MLAALPSGGKLHAGNAKTDVCFSSDNVDRKKGSQYF